MSKKKTFQRTDEVVCILAYPNSGDQAWNNLVDLGAMSLDPDPNCQSLVQAIRKAMKSRMKIGESDFIHDGFLHDYDVTCPCTVIDCVTIYDRP